LKDNIIGREKKKVPKTMVEKKQEGNKEEKDMDFQERKYTAEESESESSTSSVSSISGE
jgi:hypothetical protein